MATKEEARAELERILDEHLRPYLESHGGNVDVVDFNMESGIVQIMMEGGCSGCPAALMTLRFAIEATLKEYIPWVKKVEALNDSHEPDFGIILR